MTDATAQPISDAALVERAKGGDLESFEALITRHERRVYSLSLRMLRHEQDAEDVTQDTFLSALENLDGFRGEAQFSTWLLRIATHAATCAATAARSGANVGLAAGGGGVCNSRT